MKRTARVKSQSRRKAECCRNRSIRSTGVRERERHEFRRAACCGVKGCSLWAVGAAWLQRAGGRQVGEGATLDCEKFEPVRVSNVRKDQRSSDRRSTHQ